MKINKEFGAPHTIASACIAILLSFPAFAVDVEVKEELIRVADNAIFLVDTSSSMNEKFRDTGKSKRELVESEFIKRNETFPDIGHNFGIYTYTKWKEFYPLQPYNRAKVADALEQITKKNVGPTPLKEAMEKLEPIIEPLSGRTAVFVFSDGTYTGNPPGTIARTLALKYDICFYVISTAKPGVNNELQASVAGLNGCSRMIPLEDYLAQPEYQSGALYVAKSTTEAIRVKSSSFAFNEAELQGDSIAELDELAEVLGQNENAFVVLSGYTDSIGSEDYNEGLSRRRAEAVSNYMVDNHGVEKSRMILQWYGSDNPIASNDTEDGRATNRRVEINVKGL